MDWYGTWQWTPAFEQQLILAAVDVGGLLLTAVLVGWFVKRSVEAYRASQEIRVVVAEMRIKEIAPLWNRLRDVGNEVASLWADAQMRAYEAAQKAAASPGAQELQSKHRPELRRELGELLLERVDRIRGTLSGAESDLHRAWFWLGRPLHQLHSDFLLAAWKLFNEAQDYVARDDKDFEFQKLVDSFKRLNKQQLTIEDVLRRL